MAFRPISEAAHSWSDDNSSGGGGDGGRAVGLWIGWIAVWISLSIITNNEPLRMCR